jgi:hypothetical protein
VFGEPLLSELHRTENQTVGSSTVKGECSDARESQQQKNSSITVYTLKYKPGNGAQKCSVRRNSQTEANHPRNPFASCPPKTLELLKAPPRQCRFMFLQKIALSKKILPMLRLWKEMFTQLRM